MTAYLGTVFSDDMVVEAISLRSVYLGSHMACRPSWQEEAGRDTFSIKSRYLPTSQALL